ncbi:MAG: MOSC domain-containing protein [Halieaceae bacterium]|jgi:uncharacterized protein|nr:MOSC domain-containing protein [Halieaceae bacterium]
MKTVGRVSEIWRYPVKSLGGESLERADIHAMGVCGDRSWALVDRETSDIIGAKRYARLLELSASYSTYSEREWLYGPDVPSANILLQDGNTVDTRAKEAQSLLTELIGAEVTLEPLQPPESRDHYRLSKPLSEEDIARQMNIKKGEEAPTFDGVDQEMLALLAEYATPPGKYVDAFPLHLLTTASLDQLRLDGGGDANARRFRPNLIIEPDDNKPQYLEFSWVGKTLTIGSTVLKVDSRTIRCAVPARAQPQYKLQRDPEVSQALYRNTERNLGVNIVVIEPGTITVGDSVQIQQ